MTMWKKRNEQYYQAHFQQKRLALNEKQILVLIEDNQCQC